MWAFLAGYTVFIAAFSALVFALRAQWRGMGMIWVSAAIGPALTIVVTLAFTNADPAYFWFLVIPLAIGAALATAAIGALVSWGIFSYLK